MKEALRQFNIDASHVFEGSSGNLTPLGMTSLDYLNKRAVTIESEIKPKLMNNAAAKELFDSIKSSYSPRCDLPMNKQKGEKRHEAYMTGTVNMLTEKEIGADAFEADPKGLTIVLKDGVLKATFSRRMDGIYPHRTNPKTIWEIKEYYGTTTFGSRVATRSHLTMS